MSPVDIVGLSGYRNLQQHIQRGEKQHKWLSITIYTLTVVTSLVPMFELSESLLSREQQHEWSNKNYLRPHYHKQAYLRNAGSGGDVSGASDSSFSASSLSARRMASLRAAPSCENCWASHDRTTAMVAKIMC